MKVFLWMVGGLGVLALGLWGWAHSQSLKALASALAAEARSRVPPASAQPAPAEAGWIRMEALPPGATIHPQLWSGLPAAARRYFNASGAAGRKPAAGFSLEIRGRIRQSADSPWMDVSLRQYNHMNPPARIVFIETPGGPMTGLDSYLGGRGRMTIRLLGLVTLTDSAGPEMDVSALVTFVNDLVFCPTAYFALDTAWKDISKDRVALRFRDAGLQIEAELDIDGEGRLRNWRSKDRYAELGGRFRPDRWETPIRSWTRREGLLVPATGVGIHDFDGRPYEYFEILDIPVLTPGGEL